MGPWIVVLLLCGVAQAQPPPAVAPPGPRLDEEPEVRPPELVVPVEIGYPEDALRDRVEGRVILELTISAEGKVEKAEVIEGPSISLNHAARQAAPQFEFMPARRAGVPHAARIRFAYDFRLPAEEPLESIPAEATSPVRPVAQRRASADSPPTSEPKRQRSGRASTNEVVEVEVRGYREADRLRRSAAAITVVELEHAKRESSDVAGVLARVEGVGVQRVGGLGSQVRFSLGGFDDTQVRFFIDGIPVEYQGFSLGIQNVPLSFAERIEIYKGMVPIQFGADSLGGAFNLVTDRRASGTHASASYQAGSFDTSRITASTRHLDESTGCFVKGEGFFDSTDNSYPIDATVGDATGQSRDVTVRRFHDGYRAQGGNLEVGFVNRKWVRRLLLKTFVNRYDKELQHNARMTTPYGEVTSSGISGGGNLRYEHDFGQGLSGSFVSGYVYERSDFLDAPTCVYNWLGRCVQPRDGSGEIRDRETDQSLLDHTGYLRWNLALDVSPHHRLGVSIAPTFFTRTGKDHLISNPDAFMPLSGRRDLFKWVSGAEYEVAGLSDRLENVFFVKAYLHTAGSDELLSQTVTVNRRVQRMYWGVGDGVRYQLNQWAIAKASYEYSVRLPEPREIFGNGAQVGENLDLEPERSHNVNLTLLANGLRSNLGQFDASVTGFYRDATDLILLLGRAEIFYFENVFRARVIGIESAANWLVSGEFLELGANATYQDFRNKAEKGPFAHFEGDRVPNKPYLFANGSARLQLQGVAAPSDELSLTWYTRYVHDFFRTWESVGREEERPVIASQFVQSAVISYANQLDHGREVSFSFDAQNLTDVKVFDFYGVQRPGRAIFFKTVLVY